MHPVEAIEEVTFLVCLKTNFFIRHRQELDQRFASKSI